MNVLNAINKDSFTCIRQKLFVGGCLLMATLIVINTCLAIYLNYWHGPFRDMWEIFPFLIDAEQSRWNWAKLWSLYGNAHRLVIPKLLYVADYQWFSGSNYLLIFVSLFCQLLITAVFFRAVFCATSNERNQQHSLTREKKWFMYTLILSLMFSATLMFNFLHTFDVQWFTCCLFITLCFFVLLTPSNTSVLFLYLSLFFGILATMSNFAGMAFWPVWVLLVLKKGYSKKTCFLIFLLSALYIGTYVSGMSGVQSEDTSQPFFYLLLFVFVSIVFPLLFLASPLSEFHPFMGAFISAVALFPLFRFWWLYFFKKQNFSVWCLFFASLALFCYGVATEIALGRWYGPEHYHASRYQNIVVLFWSAWFCFWLVLSKEQMKTIVFKKVFSVFLVDRAVFISVCIFSSIFLFYQYSATLKAYTMGTNVRLAHVAFTLGYSDKVPLIMPTKSRHWAGITWHNFNREYHFMKDNGVGPMSEDAYRLYSAGLPKESFLDHLPACPDLDISFSTHRKTGVIQFAAAIDADFMSEYAPSSFHVFSEKNNPLGYAIAFHDREPLKYFKQLFFDGRRQFFGYLTREPGVGFYVLAGSGNHFVCEISKK